jgi:putative tryptophan/tyrosine transport system substrate-binding protein
VADGGEYTAATAAGDRFLHGSTPESYVSNSVGFAQGLKESNFVEGQNVAVEYRWGNAQPDLLPGLAADLVRRQVTVIVAGGGYPAALAASCAAGVCKMCCAC